MDRKNLQQFYKPEAKIAIEMPGKIGDFLYTLPLARYLAEVKGTKVDLWTSNYCRPAIELLEYQSCTNKVIIPDDYIPERFDMGVQPPIQVPYGMYETVYSCTFRSVPDTRLDHFMALSVGIEPHLLPPVYYEIDDYYTGRIDNKQIIVRWEEQFPNGYYVLGTRGITSYDDTFREFTNRSTLPVIIIGAKGEYNGYGLNFTGLDLLKTAYILSKSKGYVGLMSSMLVLANGFNIKKVVPHDGRSWDMRHVVYSDNHNYLVNPTAQEILEVFNG